MDWFEEVCGCPCMERIKDIGMNCGCEYTSFPRFVNIGKYSRFDHSVGVGRIVYEHTGSARQSIAGLLHDVATPAFAHVIDFMHGDHLTQESTEDKTLEIIASDAALVAALAKLGLKPEDVCDYHLFPIADNDTPKLSADRLDYSLGNMVNYGFATKEKADALYADVIVGENEDGDPELMFNTEAAASDFAFLSLDCSKVYVSDEDRYAMQRLAELVKKYVDAGVVTEDDLWTTETQVIAKLTASEEGAKDWSAFRSMHKMIINEPGPDARKIIAKKRHIDPYVKGKGRVTSLNSEYNEALRTYLAWSLDYWLSAE